MPIDTSFYSLAGRGVKSVADYDNEFAQSQNNKLTLALTKQKMEDAERDRMAENELARLLGMGEKDVAGGLARAGYGRAAIGYQEKQSKLAKEGADAEKARAEVLKIKNEVVNKKVQQARDVLASVNDPQTAASWVAGMYSDPDFAPLVKLTGKTVEQAVASIPQDPEGFNKWRMGQMLGAEQMVKYTTPDANTVANNQTSRDNNAATNARVAADNAASRAVQIRGQNLTDARSREATAATVTKPFEVTGPDGKPVLVQQDKAGNIRPVEGFLPKQGPGTAGTEGERTAAGYADRMTAAEQIIGTVAKATPKAQKPGLVEQAAGGVGVIANLSRDAERQKYRQAQEDWVRAKLRKESGAVIANDEMEREISVYFPQIGDSDAVIQQKAEARKVAEQSMRKSAGRAASPASGGASGGWSIQKVN